MKYMPIVLSVLLLSSCSTMDRWMDSSGSSSSSSSSGRSDNHSTALNNTSVNPAVINDAADPRNIYFGD